MAKEKMNKIKYFINKFEEFKKKIKMKPDIHLQKDNRLNSKVASVDIYRYIDGRKELCYVLKYNTNQLKSVNKIQVLTIIGHELGHIKFKHLKSYRPLEELEYEAEKFALDMIKKYYPKHYKSAVNSLKIYIGHSNKLYANAFEKLYKERKYVANN
jgi:hypothetical protein